MLRGAVALAIAFLVLVGAANAQDPAVLELVERYRPILMLKENPDPPCSTRGEQYWPSPVEITLGNPEVELVRSPSRSGEKPEVLASGPTAEEIAGLGGGYYLDQPGNPYSPGCTYARTSAELTAGLDAVAYAHVATEPGVRGIALQFWFYWWFNEFNDRHESDWEMIQLAFDAETVDEALEVGASRIAYAQHGGGERHGFGDPEVEKEGTHPVVYVASGSHASQFSSALFLGTGQQGSGLGCDDTRGPHVRVEPVPVVVETFPAMDGPQGWLTYQGHWGQQARGFSNGVTGPNMKQQWLEPFRWMAKLRNSTPEIPLGDTIGPSVTGFFCGAVAAVSGFITFVTRESISIVVVIIVVLLALAIPAKRTRWSPVNPTPVRQPRAFGQLVRASSRIYRRDWRTYVLAGLVSLPLGAAALGAQKWLFDFTGLRPLLNQQANEWLSTILAVFVGSFGHLISFTLVGGAVVAAIHLLEHGRAVRVRSVLSTMRPRLVALLGTQLLAIVVVYLLTLTIVGIPLAVKKAVDWTFIQQVVLLEGVSGRRAFGASTAVCRGAWWRTAGIALFLFGVSVAVGPIVGVLMIFLTDLPLTYINLFGSVLYGLVIPWVAIGRTLLYFDLTEREPALRPGLRARLEAVRSRLRDAWEARRPGGQPRRRPA